MIKKMICDRLFYNNYACLRMVSLWTGKCRQLWTIHTVNQPSSLQIWNSLYAKRRSFQLMMCHSWGLWMRVCFQKCNALAIIITVQEHYSTKVSYCVVTRICAICWLKTWHKEHIMCSFLQKFSRIETNWKYMF